MKNKKFSEGGMWEYAEWEINYDVECSSYGGSEPCRHCGSTYHVDKYRSDRSVYNKNELLWVCPRVVVASNEGGYNTTGVCLDCILEAVKK